jgi:ribonucleotide reductase beta subunit family protein with ferritin-like domain
MISKHLIPVTTHKEIVDFADKQLKIFWLPDEINVEKDIQDIKVNLTEAERHGVITTLKLFTLYETHAGSEYWGNRFRQIFNGAEFERMASVFSMFELAVHAPFYNKINQLLHLDNEEFYTSYLQNPLLKERIDFIGNYISDHDPLISLSVFSLVEGVILYSNFAFLKHYQSQGKNSMMNIVRGINFSVRDENLHSAAGAWCFRLKMQDAHPTKIEYYQTNIKLIAERIYDHECGIIDMIFEKGDIKGITAHQLRCFVQSRINECLKQLGFDKLYDVKYDPISSWFYKGINNYQFNDFFAGQSREYHRNWDEASFKWKKDV